MWALKNSFLVSMSTMYLNFDRRKTRFETVLHTLFIYVSPSEVYCLWLYLKDRGWGRREKKEREKRKESRNFRNQETSTEIKKKKKKERERPGAHSYLVCAVPRNGGQHLW